MVKIKPKSFNFVRNDFKNFVLALQNVQNPPFYGLRFTANSGKLCNSDIKLLFVSIITFSLPFHNHSYDRFLKENQDTVKKPSTTLNLWDHAQRQKRNGKLLPERKIVAK